MSAPERIGKYTVIRKLGEGATSTVYLGHDPFADFAIGDLPSVLGREVVVDAVRQFIELFGADRALVAGSLQAQVQFGTQKIFTAAITLQHLEFVGLDHFVSGEAMSALEAFAAATNGDLVLR